MRPGKKRTKKPPARVAEPVQVYLAEPDRDRLERLAEELGLTKSDVLRRGLLGARFEREKSVEVAPVEPLPVFRGGALQPGVDLDDSAALTDRMDDADATG